MMGWSVFRYVLIYKRERTEKASKRNFIIYEESESVL